MAREPRIMLWCDVHLNLDTERVEGETQVVGVMPEDNPTEIREIELCKSHGDAPHSQVLMWGLEYGREYNPSGATKSTPKRKSPSTSVYDKAKDGRLQCPHCEDTKTTPGRVDSHIIKEHPGAPLGA